MDHKREGLCCFVCDARWIRRCDSNVTMAEVNGIDAAIRIRELGTTLPMCSAPHKLRIELREPSLSNAQQ